MWRFGVYQRHSNCPHISAVRVYTVPALVRAIRKTRDARMTKYVPKGRGRGMKRGRGKEGGGEEEEKGQGTGEGERSILDHSTAQKVP